MRILSFAAATAMLLAASCTGNKLPEDNVLMGYNWSVQFESKANPEEVINLDRDEFKCEVLAPGEYRYTCDDAVVSLKWTCKDGRTEVAPTVTNTKEGYIINSMIGPLFPIDRKIEEYNLLVPSGYGARYTKTPKEEDEFLNKKAHNGSYWEKKGQYFEPRYSSGLVYPSRACTMQWGAFAGENDGVMLASFDETFSYKHFTYRYYPGEDIYRFGVRNHHILNCGETWTVPATTMICYKGDWHKAADIYRDWFNAHCETVNRPEWIKKSTGWLLTILKQQNDEIIWPYTDLKLAADVAEARGLDIVGLFGWTAGGHDRWYPEYDPCPLMGGKEALMEGLKAIRDRGMRSIIYVNGQLQDMDGTKHWWEETGKDITIIRKNGSFDYETWHKYTDAPARRHGRPCHHTQIWRDKMLSLAMMADSLGADGIIYDQLGVLPPTVCYASNHGHEVPAITLENDRLANIQYVREEMAKINPEFIVITEGSVDSEVSGIDMFHGCSYALYTPSQAQVEGRVQGTSPIDFFPEMLRYTIPQLEATLRHPCPVCDRILLNYGAVFGIKHELETRYAADRKYLLEDHVPALEDYGNVIAKPNISEMQTEDAVAMRIYSKQVLDLRKKYSECLLEGRYVDDCEVFLQSGSNDLIAKAFVSQDGKKAAVVVWNTSASNEVAYSVGYGRWKETGLDAPEDTPEKKLLAPQSIQVVLFEK